MKRQGREKRMIIKGRELFNRDELLRMMIGLALERLISQALGFFASRCDGQIVSYLGGFLGLK